MLQRQSNGTQIVLELAPAFDAHCRLFAGAVRMAVKREHIVDLRSTVVKEQRVVMSAQDVILNCPSSAQFPLTYPRLRECRRTSDTCGVPSVDLIELTRFFSVDAALE